MSVDQWNERGRIWEDDHGWLDEEQILFSARKVEKQVVY